MLVVDIRHWLTPDLSLPTDNLRLRRQVLKIARLVEYGGPLPPGHTRETLVECSRRPNRQQCLGLLWVTKQDVETIFAHCLICGGDQIHISGWEDTDWAEGPMEPAEVPEVH